MAGLYFDIGVNDQTRDKLSQIIASIKTAGKTAAEISSSIMNTVSSAYSTAVRRSVVSGSSIKDALMESYKQLVNESEVIGEEMHTKIEEALKNPLDTSGIKATIDQLKAQLAELQSKGITSDNEKKAVEELASSIGVLEGAVEMANFQYEDYNKCIDRNRKLMIDMRARGEENTQAYRMLEAETLQYQQAIDDTNDSLNKMKEEGKGLTTLVGTFQALTGMLSTYAGVMAMVGEEDEDAAKQQQKLQSIMSVTVGVQSIYNSLQSKSAIMSGVYALKASAAAKAMEMQAKATKSATIAQKALNVVAKANPYTLLAIAIASVVGAIALWRKSNQGLSKELQQMTKAMSSATAQTNLEKANLSKLVTELKNANEGSEEYQKIKENIVKNYSKYLPNLATELSDIKNLSTCYDKLATSIEKAAKSKSYIETMQKAQEEYATRVTKNLTTLQERWIETYGEEEGMRLVQVLNDSMKNGQIDFKSIDPKDFQKMTGGGSWFQNMFSTSSSSGKLMDINQAMQELQELDKMLRNAFDINTPVAEQTEETLNTMSNFADALKKLYEQIANESLNIQKQQTKDKIKQLEIERKQALNTLQQEKADFIKQYGDKNKDEIEKAFKQKEYLINLKYDTNLLEIKQDLNKFIKEIKNKPLSMEFVSMDLDTQATEINNELANLTPLQKRIDKMKELLEIDKERLKVTYENGREEINNQEKQDIETAKNNGGTQADIKAIQESYNQQRLIYDNAYQAQLSQLELQGEHNILNEKLKAYEDYVTGKFAIDQQYEDELRSLQEKKENGEITEEQYNTGVSIAGTQQETSLNDLAMQTLGEMDSSFEEEISDLVGDVLAMSLEKLQEYIPTLQKQLQQLKSEGKDTSEVQVQINAGLKRMGTLQTQNTSKGDKGYKKLTTRTQTFTQAIQMAQSEMSTLTEIFGDDMTDAQKSMLEGTESLVAGIAMLGVGIQAAIEAEKDAEKGSVILTVIALALEVLNATIKVFKQLFASDSIAAEERVEANTKKIEKLQLALKKLETAQKSQTGTKYWQTQSDSIANMQEQLKLYQKNIQEAENMSKNANKKKDRKEWAEKLNDYQEDYLEMEQQIIDAQNELIEGVTGLSFDSLTESLADSIIEGFESGLDGGLDAWDDAVDDMMTTMLKTQMTMQIQNQLQPYFDRFFKQIEANAENGTQLSEAQYKAFASEMESQKEKATSMLEYYNKLYQELGLNQSDQVDATEGAFESMSQDTADELNARFTALQIEGSNLVVGQGVQTEAMLAMSNTMDGFLSIFEDVPYYVRLMNSGLNSLQDLAQTQSDRLLIIANNTELIADNSKYLKTIYNKL